MKHWEQQAGTQGYATQVRTDSGVFQKANRRIQRGIKELVSGTIEPVRRLLRTVEVGLKEG